MVHELRCPEPHNNYMRDGPEMPVLDGTEVCVKTDRVFQIVIRSS